MSDIDNPQPPPASPPPPSPPPPPVSGAPSADDRQWAMFAHLSALAGLVIPFGNVLGPLIIWQIKKDELPFAAENGKEALNFNITVAIAMMISMVLVFIVIGVFLAAVVFVAWVVLAIIAAVKANNGESYRYPFILRLVS